MSKKTELAKIRQAWIAQARDAIRQGQSITDFVLHAAVDNRSTAYRAYRRAEKWIS